LKGLFNTGVIFLTGGASSQEMVALLVQTGLFDTSLTLCQTFNLSLTPVFEGLTFKYVMTAERTPYVSVNPILFRRCEGHHASLKD